MNKHLDKIAHYSASFVIAYYATLFFGMVTGCIIALVFGIGKELRDEFKKYGSGWSTADLLADALGILSFVAGEYLKKL